MMKTIDKMTDQEIYDLTDEQVEKLIVRIEYSRS